MRLENRTLAAQLRTEAQERRSLKKESAALTSEVTYFLFVFIFHYKKYLCRIRYPIVVVFACV